MASRIVRWNADKGFGFVAHGGQELFLHATAIEPRQPRGADLRGREVEVRQTSLGPKGPKVDSARLLPSAAELAEEAAREAAAQERKRAREAQRERDLEILRSLAPKVKSQIPVLLPLGSQGRAEIDGVSVGVLSYRSEVKGFDSQEGAVVRYVESIRLYYGEALLDLEPMESVRSGWGMVRLNRLSYHDLDRASAELIVQFEVDGHVAHGRYPATPHPPYIEGDDVRQGVTAQTPLGEAVETLILYENPDRGFAKDDGPWGPFTIEALVAEVDTQALKKMGILGEKPKVEVVVGTYGETYQVGGSWESDDGWRAGNDSHDATVSRGGVVLNIHSRFLGWRHGSSAGTMLMVQGLDRGKVETAVREEIRMAIEHRRLTKGAGEEYGPVLFAHIMSFVPEFRPMDDMVALEEATWNLSRRLEGVPHGFAVVEFEDKNIDYYLRHHTSSKVVKVLPRPKAEELGLPGEPLPDGTIVYWPEGQKDERFKVTEEVEFGDPPLPVGTQVKATFTTEGRPFGPSLYRRAGVEMVFHLTIRGVPATKYRVTRLY